MVPGELFTNSRDGERPLRKEMDPGARLPANGFIHMANIESNRPANDFTPRAIPYHPNPSVPLEANQILWQK
jgi:starch phosphorylase